MPCIPQNLVKPPFLTFAREERDSHGLRGADVRRQFGKHCNAAGHVEAADTDRQTGSQERSG